MSAQREADYTLTREEFMRAVKRATRSKVLLAQAERQEWFPLGVYFTEVGDCGCVVGEVVADRIGRRDETEILCALTERDEVAGTSIDKEVERLLAIKLDVSPWEIAGFVHIVDQGQAA